MILKTTESPFMRTALYELVLLSTFIFILSAFALPHLTWFWVVYFFGIGIVVLPIFRKAILSRKILINESKSKILRFRYPLPFSSF